MDEHYKLECLESLDKMIDKYKKDTYMLNRIHSHITHNLPNTLEYEHRNHERRIDRANFLSKEQETFIQVFLQKNLYFYLCGPNLFYKYDGINYQIVREDDIIHNLLSTISKDRVLLDWKQKTKIHILKLIKEGKSLFNSIPESDTIQSVLNTLCPTFFENKRYTKYFLTVLGDNILKKNGHLIFLMNTEMKKIMSALDNISDISIGFNGVTSNFVTKYHESHLYENCRLIKMNENVSRELWKDAIKKIGLNLICVAVHYSKRYDNSDRYVEKQMDDDHKKYINYVKDHTSIEIVDEFCGNYIQEQNSELGVMSIDWKNLHFVWKQFLNDKQYPNMMYLQTLKSHLIDKYEYDKEKDLFYGIASQFIPLQREFLNFWDKNITNSETAVDPISNFDNELEIDEICVLFKSWLKQNSEHKISGCNISENTILKIISHYYNTVEIVEDKYLLNISCVLWDKINDIRESFEYIKSSLETYDYEIVPFDDVYNYYYEYTRKTDTKMIVSKRYFSKYLYYMYSDNIVYDKFIEVKFLYSIENI